MVRTTAAKRRYTKHSDEPKIDLVQQIPTKFSFKNSSAVLRSHWPNRRGKHAAMYVHVPAGLFQKERNFPIIEMAAGAQQKHFEATRFRKNNLVAAAAGLPTSLSRDVTVVMPPFPSVARSSYCMGNSAPPQRQ
jgi:hypothetical protein